MRKFGLGMIVMYKQNKLLYKLKRKVENLDKKIDKGNKKLSRLDKKFRQKKIMYSRLSRDLKRGKNKEHEHKFEDNHRRENSNNSKLDKLSQNLPANKPNP